MASVSYLNELIVAYNFKLVAHVAGPDEALARTAVLRFFGVAEDSGYTPPNNAGGGGSGSGTGAECSASCSDEFIRCTNWHENTYSSCRAELDSGDPSTPLFARGGCSQGCNNTESMAALNPDTGGNNGEEADGEADDNGEDDEPCFPSAATVTRAADGAVMRMDALREGDAIVALTANGVWTTDTVSLLSIAKPEAQATFVTLTTDAGQTLTLTPEHHLPVGEACCSYLKRANEVLEGDKVWTTSGAALVTKRGATIQKGLHSPVLTHGTFPVVDGIVTSFDSIEGVQIGAMLGPFLFPFIKATGSAALVRRLLFSSRQLRYIDGFTVGAIPAAAKPALAMPLPTPTWPLVARTRCGSDRTQL